MSKEKDKSELTSNNIKKNFEQVFTETMQYKMMEKQINYPGNYDIEALFEVPKYVREGSLKWLVKECVNDTFTSLDFTNM